MNLRLFVKVLVNLSSKYKLSQLSIKIETLFCVFRINGKYKLIMNTKKAIIYDDTCPMCKIYTDAFVKNGLLTQEGRISFADLNENNACQIDFEKGRHEIPLIDLDGGKTIYGLDSMVYLLNQRFKIVGTTMKIKPIYWFFKKLYTVISYNRRVIAPSKKQIIKYDSTPDFNLKYRLIYITFALVLSLIIFSFAIPSIVLTAPLKIILAAMLITGFSGALSFNGNMVIEYLGQWSTVLLIGSLVISPVLIIPSALILFSSLAFAAMISRFSLSFYNLR